MWGTDSAGFSWDFGLVGPSSWSFIPQGTNGSGGTGGTTSSGPVGSSPTSPAGQSVPWYEALLKYGLGAFTTWLSFDLQNEQVAKGQYPGLTGPGGPGGVGSAAGGGGFNLGSFIPIIVLAIGGLVLFSLIKTVLK